MKRKLISFDAFKKIEEGSLTNAQAELIGIEDVLAQATGFDNLKLFTFGENDATYQADDGTFIHAIYKIEDDNLVLENVEQLVIDEETEKKVTRSYVSEMVNSLLEGNEVKANQSLEKYLSSPSIKREFLVGEAFKISVSKPTGASSPLRHKKQNRSLVAKRIRARMKTMNRMSSSQKKQLASKRAVASHKLGGSTNPRARVYARKVKPGHMREWSSLCENVYGYLDYKQFGPILKESMVRFDNDGNLTAIAFPTEQKRNENRILSFDWKTLDTEFKVLRNKVTKISEDQNFVKAMADLKRYNNISDSVALEETLEAIVSKWPNVLYVTENELAKQIAIALESGSVKNYDDATCNFMAEAILRTAHNAFTDRVKKISTLAGVANDVTAECKTCEDAYVEFKNVADSFYKKLDESEAKELQIFSDLLNTLGEIRKLAAVNGDELTKIELESYMDECSSILNRENDVDLELVETIANYIRSILEANLEGSSNDWDVSNDVHISATGDHPRAAWNATQKDATPSKYNGDWKDSAPVSDGESYENGLADDMKNNSWGNIGGKDVYPDLKNPYVPASGDFKMKEKSAVDDGESDWANFQSKDTWPALNNPYVPTEAGPRTVKD